MPPKRRPIKTEFAKVVTVDSGCQTELYDEEFQRELLKINVLRKQSQPTSATCDETTTSIVKVEDDVGQTSSTSSPSSSDATAPPNPHVLFVQLRACTRIIAKLSADSQRSRADNARIVSSFGEIFRLLRAMKCDYDSTLQTTRDSVKAMGADMTRHVADVREMAQKQKAAAEEDRRRYKQKLKSKDVQIEHLQEKLRESIEYETTMVEALEAEQRRITIAEREVHTCREKVREVNNKLSDQLFLAGNQKCMSCQANEKVREMLSNEVAEKTNTANVFHQKYVEIESQLTQQKRVNELLSRAVDRHSFAEKAIRGEFERIKTEYNNLIGETRTLRTQAKLAADASAASSTVTITPPDSEKSTNSKDDFSKVSSDAGSEPGEIVGSSPNDHELMLARRIVRRPTKFNKTALASGNNVNNNFKQTGVGLLTGGSTTAPKELAKPESAVKSSAKVTTAPAAVPYALKPVLTSSFTAAKPGLSAAQSTDPSTSQKKDVLSQKSSPSALPSSTVNSTATDTQVKDEKASESGEIILLHEAVSSQQTVEANPSTSTVSTRPYSNGSAQGEASKSITKPSKLPLLDSSEPPTSTAGANRAVAVAKTTLTTTKPVGNEPTEKKPTSNTSNSNNNRKRTLGTPNGKPACSNAKIIKKGPPPRPNNNVQKTMKSATIFQPTAPTMPAAQGLPLLRATMAVARHQHAHQQRVAEARRLATLQEEAIRVEQQQITRERQMIQARREAQQIEMLREQQLRQRMGGPSFNSGRPFGGSPPFNRSLPPRPPAGMPRPPDPLVPPRHGGGGVLPWHGRPAPPQQPPSQKPAWMRQPPFGRRS